MNTRYEPNNKDATPLAEVCLQYNVQANSTVELCRYEAGHDGFNKFVLTEGLNLREFIEIANVECSMLGIAPAVSQKDLDDAMEYLEFVFRERFVGETCEVKGFIEGTTSMIHDEMEGVLKEQDLKLPTLREAIMENVLTHIFSRGTVNSFQDLQVNVAGSDDVLARGEFGLLIYLREEEFSEPTLGCGGRRS